MIRPILLLLLLFPLRSCCPSASHVEPPYPKAVRGWDKPDERSSRVTGSFVLRKGEQITNGKITIMVVDLLPGDACAEHSTQAAGARAKLRFISTVDRRIICEDEFPDNGFMDVHSTWCGDRLESFGTQVISINAISLKDNWVYVVLS